MPVFINTDILACLGHKLYAPSHTLVSGREARQFRRSIPGASDLVVTRELCHWWFRDLAAPADHVGQVFGLPARARDTEHPQLACFTFSRCQDLGSSLALTALS